MTRGIKGSSKRGPQGAKSSPRKKGQTFGAKVKNYMHGYSEKRFHVKTDLSVAIAEDGLIISLTPIPTGSREGDIVQSHSLNVKYLAKIHSSATSSQIRIVGFIWRQDNLSGVPTTSQIIHGVGTIPNWLVAPTELDKAARKRFTVLFDRTHLLTATGDSTAVQGEFNVSRNKLPSKMEFIASGITGTNLLFVVALSNEATNTVALTMVSTYKYLDL